MLLCTLLQPNSRRALLWQLRDLMSLIPEEDRSFMPTAHAKRTSTASSDPWSGTEYKKFRNDVSDIATAAREFAHLSRFIRRYTGWVIGAVGILFPTVAHYIQQLPPLPH